MTGPACARADCGGTIAADGYCDTCGFPAAPAAAPTTGAPRAAVGDPCRQPDCGGTIATDGYCDTCGLSASTTPHLVGGPTIEPPSIAAPVAPGTSARVGSSTPTGGSSRRTTRASQRTTARTRLGAGLVDVAPTPVGDPAGAVMSEERIASVLGAVPEEERVCTSCGRPVGRGSPERPGRVQGFCGHCRTPFDFVTNAPALAAGELVAGQYEILGPLAHGGMGWIYLGRDKAVSDRWVVLKGLLSSDDPDAALAAVAERQFLAQIEHPNIVNIYNFVTHRGAGYIVMEMVGGESLNSKLKDRRRANNGVPDPLPVATAIAYILGVLPAFGYLHEHGLVYNDLKPANIMSVGADVKLIDVGAVMRVDDHDAAIFGTQGFQAPEVASVGPSFASDLHTVGRTLAVLMLDFVFHDGPYQHGLPTPLEEPVFARWESLYRFLLKATAPHPDDRFQTAAGMADQLTGVLREVTAVSEGKPRSMPSTLFGTDQLTNLLVDATEEFDVTAPDWRVLPPPKIEPEDPAAAVLLDLPELEPQRTIELLDAALADGQIDETTEVRLRRARALIELRRGAEDELAALEQADPWEWRVEWLRSLDRLINGRPADAAEGFSRVWTEVPGEIAPKLAVALAAERADEYERAAALYERVIATDSTFVSAAFGLARCRRALGDGPGAVAAYGRVPASSATYHDAQLASARALVEGDPARPPGIDELTAAARTVERLQLDAVERAALSADILERALDAVEHGTSSAIGSGVQLFGSPLDEHGLRTALERVYREQARLSSDPEERIALVDRANSVRPRSLV